MDSACQKAAKNIRSIIDDGHSTSKKDMNNNNNLNYIGGIVTNAAFGG